MKVTDDVQGDVTQIFLDGRFDANTAGMVEQFIRDRMEKDSTQFVINMEKVPFVASAGLRVVLVIAKELRQKNKGDLRIACLQPNVNKVFEISGLNNVLRIFDDLNDATTSFGEQTCLRGHEVKGSITFQAIMRLSFDFPADTGILARIGEIVANASRKAGFAEEEISDIQLSIDEACTNTITHGLKQDPDRIFQLVIQWEQGEIEIMIHESGEPFDPAKVQVPDIKAPLEDRGIGGLGLFFVQEMMDVVEYQTGDDGTKTLRMVKRKG